MGVRRTDDDNDRVAIRGIHFDLDRMRRKPLTVAGCILANMAEVLRQLGPRDEIVAYFVAVCVEPSRCT